MVDRHIDFWLEYTCSNTLSSIATAHAHWADVTPDGARSPECLELASLHSTAVDFAKSGVPAVLPRHLRPRQWPHWMQREPAFQSTSAMGAVYDYL